MQALLKQQRLLEIENLKENIKEQDEILKYIREHAQHKTNEETNRLKFIRNKGNDILKVIKQDDERPAAANQNNALNSSTFTTREKSSNSRFATKTSEINGSS